jgi:hypothetical protein
MRLAFAAWLTVFTATFIATAYASQSDGVAKWLPRVGHGFDPSGRGQAAWSREYDYFICAKSPVAVATPFANFDYAVRGCGLLKTGTYLVYGSTEPIKGRVLYDSAHKLVLYQEGCCAWRNAVLTSVAGSPPKAVQGADLSGVRTARGVTLGMAEAQVAAIYGRAKAHSVPGASDIAMLSYTTMHGNPSSAENACGQFQNLAFRNGKLFYIELLAGC